MSGRRTRDAVQKVRDHIFIKLLFPIFSQDLQKIKVQSVTLRCMCEILMDYLHVRFTEECFVPVTDRNRSKKSVAC